MIFGDFFWIFWVHLPLNILLSGLQNVLLQFLSIYLRETDAKRYATFYVYSKDQEIQAVGQFFTPRDAFSKFIYTRRVYDL